MILFKSLIFILEIYFNSKGFSLVLRKYTSNWFYSTIRKKDRGFYDFVHTIKKKIRMLWDFCFRKQGGLYFNVAFLYLNKRGYGCIFVKPKHPWFFTLFYFVFMLILPIFSLLNTASKNLFDNFWETATEPVALSAYTVTISMAFFACIFNAFFGFIYAWVLVRYNFAGKPLLDAAVDLPFALPTSVAGLTLATVYSDQGWIGSFLSNFGIEIVFTKLGILVAMIFVSFPFVVRTLQPVLQEMEIELEEASWSLGASPWKTFQKVIFPPLIPAILTGLTLAFSRAIGEYGSIVIVSSNIPLKDLIASVLIFQNLEQYDYTRATVIGTVVLLLSLLLLLGINFLQRWNQKYLKS